MFASRNEWYFLLFIKKTFFHFIVDVLTKPIHRNQLIEALKQYTQK